MASDVSVAAVRALLDEHAPLAPVPLCPEIQTFHAGGADGELPLWLALERAVGRHVDAPFFAVPWPAAQLVARLMLDEAVPVKGQRVVELGCGQGLVAVVAALRGARATATDIDPLALSVTRALADAHGVTVDVRLTDLNDEIAVIDAVRGADVVVAADVVYNEALARSLAARLPTVIASVPFVIVADSGRPFFHIVGQQARLVPIGVADVPVARAVEGVERRVATA